MAALGLRVPEIKHETKKLEVTDLSVYNSLFFRFRLLSDEDKN